MAAADIPRVMLPVYNEYAQLAGFIGRAQPGVGPNVPKYLNSPATSTYQKGDPLFGLHQARDHLARGANPKVPRPCGRLSGTAHSRCPLRS